MADAPLPADHARVLRPRTAGHQLHPAAALRGKRLAIEALGVGRGPGEVEIQRHQPAIGRRAAQRHRLGPLHADLPAACRRRVYQASLRAWEQCNLLGASSAIRPGDSHLALPGRHRRAGGPHAALQGTEPGPDRFLPRHSFSHGRAAAGPAAAVYPASTGIGTEGRGLLLTAIALASDRQDIRAVPLENPRQTAAYDYAAAYSPQSPKFSRAMALSCGTYATIFISGTASITHSRRGTRRRRGPDPRDAGQHRRPDRRGERGRHGLPGLGTSLASLGLVRVYIKRQEDYAGGARRVPAAAGRTAHDLRRGRRLPAGIAGRDRGRGVFQTASARGSGTDRSFRMPVDSRRGTCTPCHIVSCSAPLCSLWLRPSCAAAVQPRASGRGPCRRRRRARSTNWFSPG